MFDSRRAKEWAFLLIAITVLSLGFAQPAQAFDCSESCLYHYWACNGGQGGPFCEAQFWGCVCYECQWTHEYCAVCCP